MLEAGSLIGIDTAIGQGRVVSGECLPSGVRRVEVVNPNLPHDPCGYGVGETVEQALFELNAALRDLRFRNGNRYTPASCMAEPLSPLGPNHGISSCDESLWQGGSFTCTRVEEGGCEVIGERVWTDDKGNLRILPVRTWGASFLEALDLAFPNTLEAIQKFQEAHSPILAVAG